MQELNPHLIAQTDPVANPVNIVRFAEYRITVLSDRLFRIETSQDLKFCDDATQSIWFRNAPPVKFSVETASDSVMIRTGLAVLSVHTDFEKSYVELNGEKKPLSNEGNLLGTTRTLDCFNGTKNIRDGSSLQLGNGVCSRSGVALFDDAQSLILKQSGALAPAAGLERDLYVFAFGKDYRGAVKALYSITGSTPMLPRFAFGNWWSHYHPYSDEEYLHLMKTFEKNDVPFTVATIDMDWHYSKDLDEEKGISAAGRRTAEYGFPEKSNMGWTGYSWNKNLFPSPENFLQELKKMGYTVTLNLHPADGVRYFEDCYPAMAKAMGIDPETAHPIPFDIANVKFVNAYFDILHRPLEESGVDFWWIDWQQGTKTAMAGLDPLWALNHFHYLDHTVSGRVPLIMSRYAGIGSHRYPIGFSGDTCITWDTLKLLPYFTATASNIGYSWWGHDIGGHYLGAKDDELYLRFLQFAVFCPLNRLHCANSSVISKEPKYYANGIRELAENALRLRHRMIPLLYTANYRTAVHGEALMEPLYYEWQDCPESYEFPNEYLFAGQFLVAPITKHSEMNGMTDVSVWIPEGRWTDVFTGTVYQAPRGGKILQMIRMLDSIPVLAKEGSIAVLCTDRGNSCANPEALEAVIYNGNGSYALYEDDGADASAVTEFILEQEPGKQTATFRTVGDLSCLPKHRSLTLKFATIIAHPAGSSNQKIRDLVNVYVTCNGTPISTVNDLFAEVTVTVENLDPSAVYQITVTYPVFHDLELSRQNIFRNLQKMQGDNKNRARLAHAIKHAESAKELRKQILISDFSAIEKQYLLEGLI